MINITQNRKRYIARPTVPSGTDRIEYQVSISDSTIFIGKTRYFGGTYEVDCSDWIESYIDGQEKAGNQVFSVTVTINFAFIGSTYTTSTSTITWSAEGTNLPMPVQDSSCPYLYIELSNCGFIHYDATTSKFKVPLLCKGGRLVSTSSDKLEKVNYIDRYGDSHNGSMTNRYEIECFIDPDWLNINAGYMGGVNYYHVMLALQNAKSAVMKSFGNDFINIPGMMTSSTTSLEGKVKDVEKIDVRSTYSTNNRVPTLKITFEVYK